MACARDILAEALRLQLADEPDEPILRAKVLGNLGQSYPPTGNYSEAVFRYSEESTHYLKEDHGVNPKHFIITVLKFQAVPHESDSEMM